MRSLLGPLLAASALAAISGDTIAGDAVSPPVTPLRVCADPANLPLSNARGEGYENRIASVLADELHADLSYTWVMQRRGFMRRLSTGACDLVVEAPEGLGGFLATRPYYTSSYAFVTRRDRHLDLTGFDDPRLRELRIGLHALGAEGANTPPAMALARRNLSDRVTGFPMWGDADTENAAGRIVDAVASGGIDVAIVWGPYAGWFAQSHGDDLVVTPIGGDPAMPDMPFRYSMTLAVRKDDAALRERIQAALDRRSADVRHILDSYGVPMIAASTVDPLTPTQGERP